MLVTFAQFYINKLAASFCQRKRNIELKQQFEPKKKKKLLTSCLQMKGSSVAQKLHQ